MSNDLKSSDNIMYKCKKVITLQNYKESICNWSGTFYEYIRHVKQKHKANYFVVEKEIEKFQWKLPYLGNQLDIGIFKHKLGHFLYEIVYNNDEGNLFFALSCIDNCCDCRNYLFTLVLQNKHNKKILTCKTNATPTESLKLIENQSYYVAIDSSLVQKFIDSNRLLQWYIKIGHKDDISKTDPDLMD